MMMSGLVVLLRIITDAGECDSTYVVDSGTYLGVEMSLNGFR